MDTKNVFSLEQYNRFADKINADITTIGYSENNRPIRVLKKGSGKLKVLFIARIHGNEPATTQALLEFINENSFEDLELHGIFLSNPDGAALYEKLWLSNSEPHWSNNFNDARLNANKVDINRDWLVLSQQETKAIQKFILELKPDFAVDFHEYYWSDKGYPPKYPYEDVDGFMATMTDAPFFGTHPYTKELSEQAMNSLIPKLEKEFEWKIKPRHFIGEPKNEYTPPTFLGVYLALRGIPKLLIETWGVACSTLLLDKRIAFHKKAMTLTTDWIINNQTKFLSKPESPILLTWDVSGQDPNKIKELEKTLDLHGIKFQMQNNKININSTTLEISFVKTIYYLIFEKENN